MAKFVLVEVGYGRYLALEAAALSFLEAAFVVERQYVAAGSDEYHEVPQPSGLQLIVLPIELVKVTPEELLEAPVPPAFPVPAFEEKRTGSEERRGVDLVISHTDRRISVDRGRRHGEEAPF